MSPDEHLNWDHLTEPTKAGMPRAVRTTFEYPPIPVRDYDWSASFDGYDEGDYIGRGRTEIAAVLDLFDQTLLRAFEREPAPDDSDWEKVQALLTCVRSKVTT